MQVENVIQEYFYKIPVSCFTCYFNSKFEYCDIAATTPHIKFLLIYESKAHHVEVSRTFYSLFTDSKINFLKALISSGRK